MKDLLKLTDFAVVPMAICGLVVGRAETWVSLIGYGVGFLMWTFVEYWVHRLFHRGALRRSHWVHHQHPEKLIGGTLYSTLVIVLLCLMVCSLPGLAPIVSGFLIGYFIFIFLHWSFHHAPRFAYAVPRLQVHHALHHHFNVERCFGVTTIFWDQIFRTERAIGE